MTFLNDHKIVQTTLLPSSEDFLHSSLAFNPSNTEKEPPFSAHNHTASNECTLSNISQSPPSFSPSLLKSSLHTSSQLNDYRISISSRDGYDDSDAGVKNEGENHFPSSIQTQFEPTNYPIEKSKPTFIFNAESATQYFPPPLSTPSEKLESRNCRFLFSFFFSSLPPLFGGHSPHVIPSFTTPIKITFSAKAAIKLALLVFLLLASIFTVGSTVNVFRGVGRNIADLNKVSKCEGRRNENHSFFLSPISPLPNFSSSSSTPSTATFFSSSSWSSPFWSSASISFVSLRQRLLLNDSSPSYAFFAPSHTTTSTSTSITASPPTPLSKTSSPLTNSVAKEDLMKKIFDVIRSLNQMNPTVSTFNGLGPNDDSENQSSAVSKAPSGSEPTLSFTGFFSADRREYNNKSNTGNKSNDNSNNGVSNDNKKTYDNGNSNHKNPTDSNIINNKNKNTEVLMNSGNGTNDISSTSSSLVSSTLSSLEDLTRQYNELLQYANNLRQQYDQLIASDNQSSSSPSPPPPTVTSSSPSSSPAFASSSSPSPSQSYQSNINPVYTSSTGTSNQQQPSSTLVIDPNELIKALYGITSSSSANSGLSFSSSQSGNDDSSSSSRSNTGSGNGGGIYTSNNNYNSNSGGGNYNSNIGMSNTNGMPTIVINTYTPVTVVNPINVGQNAGASSRPSSFTSGSDYGSTASLGGYSGGIYSSIAKAIRSRSGA